jgi:hypothetical protein
LNRKVTSINIKVENSGSRKFSTSTRKLSRKTTGELTGKFCQLTGNRKVDQKNYVKLRGKLIRKPDQES